IRARHCPEARRLADARGPAESSTGPRAGWKRSERDDAARHLAPLECGVRLVDLREGVGAREQLVELQLPCSVERDQLRDVDGGAARAAHRTGGHPRPLTS